MKLQNKKGFTLIELLVVITIIGILATGATATYTSQIQKARDTTRVNDIKALQAGIEQLYQDNWAYPAKTSADFGSGWVGKYVERFPSDSKTTQSCNKWSLANATPCDYLYAVKNDSNDVQNQNYNISTWFENSWNVSAKAENAKDNWVMANRYEAWVWLNTFTALVNTVTKIWTSDTTCNVLATDANYMLIKWNCN